LFNFFYTCIRIDNHKTLNSTVKKNCKQQEKRSDITPSRIDVEVEESLFTKNINGRLLTKERIYVYIEMVKKCCSLHVFGSWLIFSL